MSTRPAWAIQMYHFVTDEILTDDWKDEDDPILDDIQAAVLDILCREYGHEVIDDHCGKPDHRYCVYCRRLASTLAAGSSGTETTPEFPIFLTLDEMEELVARPLPIDIHCKIHDALGIMRYGNPDGPAGSSGTETT